MSLRDDLLAENHNDVYEAAAIFAHRLNRAEPVTLKAGYTRANAILAATEMFPEVSEDSIRAYNRWWEET